MVNIDNIKAAYRNIRPYIHKTPLIHSHSFSKIADADVYLKAENLQKTGSFKVRGAFNNLIETDAKKVIAASMGNHAQAVAYAAQRLGRESRIVMPETAPIVKEEATRGYGAEVVLHGERFQEALDYALSQAGYAFVHAFDDELIIAGQGTIGIEIMEELKDVDYVLVPVGGGGLIAGIATATKSVSAGVSVIGVQTEASPAAYLSFIEKRIVENVPKPTLADGIAIGRTGDVTAEIINKLVDDMILVSEGSIAMAIQLFLERKKLVVEGAGAVPLAALLDNKDRFRGKRVVLVVSGGNIDFTVIDRIIYKGLVESGRISVFETVLDDVPGSLNVLTAELASHRVNILNVQHDRLAEDLPLGKTRVSCIVEIRGRSHLESLIQALTLRGFEIRKRVYD